MPSYKIVLTADRSLMSSYGNGLFYGFLTTGPVRGFVPLPILMNFIFKPVPVGSKGEAILAPHGLRRIEAALVESGVVDESEIIVAPPETLRKVIGEDTKIIGIYSHDHLGRGPASTAFSGPTGIIHEEPISAYFFKMLVTSPIIQEARKRGALVVAGGPGAWQFTHEDMNRLGVDLVLYGEGEKTVPKIFSKILRGEEIKIPQIIHTKPSEYPKAEEIPLLRGATIGGLVEVSRGCGRGCNFCKPTLVPLRHRPLTHILKDIETNVKYGQKNICLHSEDILRYGAGVFEVKHEKVVELFEKASKVPGARITSFSHANLSSIAAHSKTVKAIAEILGTDYHNWIGYQTGIETGSSRLIEMHMKYKPYPF
ncbi:MAG: radical SAM protein, partial [Thermoprotei archaeon]